MYKRKRSIGQDRETLTFKALLYLRWLDRLKNDDIHEKYDVFRNVIALKHLQGAF